MPRSGRKRDAKSEIVVVSALKNWSCTECGGGGSLLTMDDQGPLCLGCADLAHLAFLPSGDAALIRRARKASGLSVADADARARRRERERSRRADQDLAFQAEMAKEIVRIFPGCPRDRAEEVARHTGARGSGRVGRSADGRAFDPGALTLAVAASVRHRDTGYDELLMSCEFRSTLTDPGEFPAHAQCARRALGQATAVLALVDRLSDAATAEGRGFHKLIGKLFTDNLASIRLVERCGFDSVGLHRRHGQLDGDWRDVLVVERLLVHSRA